MQNKLDLVIGKPALNDEAAEKKIAFPNPATYTRFVLPFAFQLQAASDILEAPSLYFTLNDKTGLSYIKRRKYFTRETADTLYQRGQWLSVCEQWNETSWGKAEVAVTLRDREFKMGMLAPQLVLFEAPEIEHQPTRNLLQTGFLYVDVYFPDGQVQPPQLDDLLVLNEYFRYFGIPYDSHAEIFKKIFKDVPVTLDGKKAIGSINNPLECYFERWAEMLNMPVKDEQGNYFHLFPKEWDTAAKAWMYNKPDSNRADHWQIYADNRCYVWTLALLEKGGESLHLHFEPDKTELLSKDYGHWVKLLNVDNPPFENGHYVMPEKTHASISQFEKDWTDKRTYKRWEEGGVWYGFCYHSAAILDACNPAASVYSLSFSPSVTYYFDTTALLFYIRMSLFRFGRELSIVVLIKDKQNQRKQLRHLREQFSAFTVLYRFPMPSNQQQSIEMYEINREFFDLDQFFEEIQQEIDNTHEYLETVEANRLALAANRLANWGLPLAAGGLMTALFSMSDLSLFRCAFKITQCSVDSELLFQAGMVFVAIAAGVWILRKQKQDK